MNRLSPLIVRRTGAHATAAAYPDIGRVDQNESDLFEDLKMFVAVWFGGLVFFATLIG